VTLKLAVSRSQPPGPHGAKFIAKAVQIVQCELNILQMLSAGQQYSPQILHHYPTRTDFITTVAAPHHVIFMSRKNFMEKWKTHSNVDIDNVSITQWPIIWNSMTCNIVNGCANGLWKSPIQQWRWVSTSSYTGIMCNFVNFISRDATSNSFTCFVQHFTS